MKAYKVFNPDWTCMNFQYEVGKTYKIEGKPEMCKRGFHACKNVSDCFSYYSFDHENKVAEVELSGTILGADDDKQCCSEITIVKELSWLEMLLIANTGNENTGHGNSGNWNSGHMNSGNRNSGNRNSGSWNSGNWNSGHFNTITPKEILIFNKLCDREKWENAQKPDFIYNIILNKWIYWTDMNDEEKKQYPNAFVCDGYLKTFGYKEAWENAYNEATQEDIELLKALPNFDVKVFEEITGIKVE